VTFATATTEREFANDETAALTLSPPSLLPIYLALQATAHHVDSINDSNDSSLTAEVILSTIATQVPGAEEKERVVQAAGEVARAAGGELHNVSALTGGMVAQEMIKIVTKQYIPVDNTCVYDGIGSRCQVLRL
jgi:amyloid beta precursor protein binding protein 1